MSDKHRIERKKLQNLNFSHFITSCVFGGETPFKKNTSKRRSKYGQIWMPISQ